MAAGEVGRELVFSGQHIALGTEPGERDVRLHREGRIGADDLGDHCAQLGFGAIRTPAAGEPDPQAEPGDRGRRRQPVAGFDPADIDHIGVGVCREFRLGVGFAKPTGPFAKAGNQAHAKIQRVRGAVCAVGMLGPGDHLDLDPKQADAAQKQTHVRGFEHDDFRRDDIVVCNGPQDPVARAFLLDDRDEANTFALEQLGQNVTQRTQRQQADRKS